MIYEQGGHHWCALSGCRWGLPCMKTSVHFNGDGGEEFWKYENTRKHHGGWRMLQPILPMSNVCFNSRFPRSLWTVCLSAVALRHPKVGWPPQGRAGCWGQGWDHELNALTAWSTAHPRRPSSLPIIIGKSNQITAFHVTLVKMDTSMMHINITWWEIANTIRPSHFISTRVTTPTEEQPWLGASTGLVSSHRDST